MWTQCHFKSGNTHGFKKCEKAVDVKINIRPLLHLKKFFYFKVNFYRKNKLRYFKDIWKKYVKKTGRKIIQWHLKYEMHFVTSTQINCDRDI